MQYKWGCSYWYCFPLTGRGHYHGTSQNVGPPAHIAAEEAEDDETPQSEGEWQADEPP